MNIIERRISVAYLTTTRSSASSLQTLKGSSATLKNKTDLMREGIAMPATVSVLESRFGYDSGSA